MRKSPFRKRSAQQSTFTCSSASRQHYDDLRNRADRNINSVAK